jgi:hypothetical protein
LYAFQDCVATADGHRIVASHALLLQFGVQNLYDPELDEWLRMDTFRRAPGKGPASSPLPAAAVTEASAQGK